MVCPSCVEPKRNPAVTTPMASSGKICLAKPQVEIVHSLLSSSFLSKSVMVLNAAIPTIIGTSGASLAFSIKFEDINADATVANAAS